MWQVAESDKQLIRYLLGDLSAEERDRFEGRYFEDDALHEQLLAMEEELVDAYVLGELSAEQRQHFEHFFLRSPERYEKVKLARALVRFGDQQAHSLAQASSGILPTVQRPKHSLRSFFDFTGFRLQLAFGGAALLAILAAFVIWQNGRQSQMARNRTEGPNLESPSSRIPAMAPPAVLPSPTPAMTPPSVRPLSAPSPLAVTPRPSEPVAAQPSYQPSKTPAAPPPQRADTAQPLAALSEAELKVAQAFLHVEIVPSEDARDIAIRRIGGAPAASGFVQIDGPQAQTPVLMNGTALARQVPARVPLPVGKYEIRIVDGDKILSRGTVEVTAASVSMMTIRSQQ